MAAPHGSGAETKLPWSRGCDGLNLLQLRTIIFAAGGLVIQRTVLGGFLGGEPFLDVAVQVVAHGLGHHVGIDR